MYVESLSHGGRAVVGVVELLSEKERQCLTKYGKECQ